MLRTFDTKHRNTDTYIGPRYFSWHLFPRSYLTGQNTQGAWCILLHRWVGAVSVMGTRKGERTRDTGRLEGSMEVELPCKSNGGFYLFIYLFIPCESNDSIYLAAPWYMEVPGPGIKHAPQQ